MRGLEICRATMLDSEEIIQMELSLQKFIEECNPSIWRYNEKRVELMRQEFNESLVDENNLILVAKVEERIVGFAHGEVQHRLDYIPKSIGWISRVYVDEAFRRKGVGSELIRYIGQFFKSQNIQEVYLRFVLGNKDAEKFWEHRGFKPIIVTANANIKTIEERLKAKPDRQWLRSKKLNK